MLEFSDDESAAADPVVTPQEVTTSAARLSPRELQVLELASLGLTNMQIAVKLRLSVHAVKFHLAAIYRKLEVSNRTEAAFVFLNRGHTVASETAGL